MTKKEEFKSFVKDNPSLIKYVKNNEMTWQKFYEIYDIYGKDEQAWRSYLIKEEQPIQNKETIDVMDFIKNINLDSIKEGVNSLQRVLSVIGDLTAKEETKTEEYKPRPIYKHFED